MLSIEEINDLKAHNFDLRTEVAGLKAQRSYAINEIENFRNQIKEGIEVLDGENLSFFKGSLVALTSVLELLESIKVSAEVKDVNN